MDLFMVSVKDQEKPFIKRKIEPIIDRYCLLEVD